MSRFDYVAYDRISTDAQAQAKHAAIELECFIGSMGPGRPQALAMTALEEVYMWIGKAIRDDQIRRNGSAPLQEARKDG